MNHKQQLYVKIAVLRGRNAMPYQNGDMDGGFQTGHSVNCRSALQLASCVQGQRCTGDSDQTVLTRGQALDGGRITTYRNTGIDSASHFTAETTMRKLCAKWVPHHLK